jgi:hypothetical protein
MCVIFKDLREAFEFVCARGGDERQAFLCEQSGKLYSHSDFCDDLNILPDDIGSPETACVGLRKPIRARRL